MSPHEALGSNWILRPIATHSQLVSVTFSKQILPTSAVQILSSPVPSPFQSLVLLVSPTSPGGGWVIIFGPCVRLFLTQRSGAKGQRASCKNTQRTKKWVSLDKSVVTSRGISGHRILIYLPLRQYRCCKAKILDKWPFPPILHLLTLQFTGLNGINKAKA